MIKIVKEGFPGDFSKQIIESPEAKAISNRAPQEIADYFRQHPSVAQDLINESSSKRFTPSTFISEMANDYGVGWISRRNGYQCEKRFATLADAATDYLLFSLGKGRWSPPES